MHRPVSHCVGALLLLAGQSSLAAPVNATLELNSTAGHRRLSLANVFASEKKAGVKGAGRGGAGKGAGHGGHGGRGSGRGAGRGGEKVLSGRGRAALVQRQAYDGTPPLPTTRPEESERICYPLPAPGAVQKQGQVGEGTSFGTALFAIASRPEVKRVLEIGTWYGGGSTINLARGVRDTAVQTLARALGSSAPADNCVERPASGGGSERCCHSLVVTMEVFEPAWKHARSYLRDWPVWCVRGSTVAAAEMLKVSEIPAAERGAHFKLYYGRDLKLMSASTPQLARFCAVYTFDLVLIDGNEYTGWAEFNRVRTECRPKWLALHDTQTLKTLKIEKYLAENTDEYRLYLKKQDSHNMKPACEIIGCKPEGAFTGNAAGWSIYERVDSAAAAAAES